MAENLENSNSEVITGPVASTADEEYRATPYDQLRAVTGGAGKLSVHRGFGSRGNSTFGAQIELEVPVQGTPEERAKAFTRRNIMTAVAERLAGELGMRLTVIDETAEGVD